MFSFFRSGNKAESAKSNPHALKSSAGSATLLPGCHGEHELQNKYGTRERALKFYDRQVLDFLSPVMQEFIGDQEVLFIATSDKHGECDCSARFGVPGFVRVLDEKYLIYPELRGNGVMASMGNMLENPHIGMIFVDFFESTVGLHVNGLARICEHDDLLKFRDKLPQDILDDISLGGNRRPERWVMVEVEEAYIHCSKHIPRLRKETKDIEWGTDDAVIKRSDFFQLDNISLLHRIGGESAINKVCDRFYRKILNDQDISRFYSAIDLPTQIQKQKKFLTITFGGGEKPGEDQSNELATEMHDLVAMGMKTSHFRQVLKHLEATLLELDVPGNEIESMVKALDKVWKSLQKPDQSSSS